MKLSRPVSQMAAVSLLVALSWSIWTLLASPLLEQIHQDRMSIAQSRAMLARYDRILAAAPDVQRELDRLKSINASEKGFLEAANPALMAAGLQTAMQRLAQDARVDLRSSRTLPIQVEGGFQRLGLDLELTASSPGLQRLLHGIESAATASFAERLIVRVPENGVTSLMADGQPSLNVSLRVAAYARQTTPGKTP